MSEPDYAVMPFERFADHAEELDIPVTRLAQWCGLTDREYFLLCTGWFINDEMARKMQEGTAIPAFRWKALDALYRKDLARLHAQQLAEQ